MFHVRYADGCNQWFENQKQNVMICSKRTENANLPKDVADQHLCSLYEVFRSQSRTTELHACKKISEIARPSLHRHFLHRSWLPVSPGPWPGKALALSSRIKPERQDEDSCSDEGQRQPSHDEDPEITADHDTP
jgi:hypothetical protein